MEDKIITKNQKSMEEKLIAQGKVITTNNGRESNYIKK